MTFTVGHVQGGTGASRKRPLKLRDWVCGCGTKRSSYACPFCGDRRPADQTIRRGRDASGQ